MIAVDVAPRGWRGGLTTARAGRSGGRTRDRGRGASRGTGARRGPRALASRSGADPERLVQALSGGLAASKVLEVKGGKLLSHDFSPGGKAEYHRKDLGIALAAARDHGAARPATAIVDQMFGALIAKGRGGWDHSALVTLVEEWSRPSGS